MRFLRLLVLSAMAAAFAAFPALASAGNLPLTQLPSVVTGTVSGGSDGIVGPGSTFSVNTPFTSTDTYSGGQGSITIPQDSTDPDDVSPYVSVNGSSSKAFNSAPAGNMVVQGATPYSFTLQPNFTCGANLPVQLTLAGADGTDVFNESMATGAAGAYRSYASTDVDEGFIFNHSVTTDVTVPVDASAIYARGARIHIDQMTYKYSPQWLLIKLVAPDGTSVTLFDGQKGDAKGTNTPTTPNTWTNMTFVSHGDPSATVDPNAPPSDPSDPLGVATNTPLYSNQVIAAPDDISTLLSGHRQNGTWHMVISDTNDKTSIRSGTRTLDRTSAPVGEIDDWQLQLADARCSSTPDAWFTPSNPTNPGDGGTTGTVVLPTSGGTLDGSSSTVPVVPGSSPQPITSYQWTSGDGSVVFGSPTSATTTLSHPRSTTPNGTSVTLTISDGVHPPVTVTRQVVFGEAPTVGAIASSASPLQINSDTTLTVPITDNPGPVSSVTWDFDDDGVFEAASTNTASGSIVHQWPDSGSHLVRVKVTNNIGISTIQSGFVVVSGQPPVADFSVSATPVIVGSQVTFDGTASNEPGGQITQWEWDFDQAGTAPRSPVGTPQFGAVQITPTQTQTFTGPGTYSVTLRVTDSFGVTTSLTKTITVTGAPVAVISATPAAPQTGQAVSFSAASSHDTNTGGSIVTYAWDLDGNGSYETTGITASKAYPNPGNVNVRLKVTNRDGASTVATLTLTVTAPGGGNGGVGNPPGGGGANPTPTPTPGAGGNTSTPTPEPGGSNPPSFPPGSGVKPDPNGPPGQFITPDGLTISFSVKATQKSATVVKKGLAVSTSLNKPASVTVQVVISAKTAKLIKVKTAKALVIGTGKLNMTAAGKKKFILKIAKKYAAKVKAAKKVSVLLKGTIASKGLKTVSLTKVVVLTK